MGGFFLTFDSVIQNWGYFLVFDRSIHSLPNKHKNQLNHSFQKGPFSGMSNFWKTYVNIDKVIFTASKWKLFGNLLICFEDNI